MLISLRPYKLRTAQAPPSLHRAASGHVKREVIQCRSIRLRSGHSSTNPAEAEVNYKRNINCRDHSIHRIASRK